MTKYKVKGTKKFHKNLDKLLNSGNKIYDKKLIEDVVDILANGDRLPARYKAHKLKGNLQNCWECHITSDWLLIWQQNDTELILILTDTGTHSDIF